MDIEKVRQALLSAKAYGVGAHLCDYDISEQDVIDVIDGLSKAMEWQTIDTAPRGLVLLYWPATKPSRGHPSNTLGAMMRVDYVGSTPHRQPTHWMPLPSPPTDLRTPEVE